MHEKLSSAYQKLEAMNLTNNHTGELKTFLYGFAMDLIRQVCKADIALQFLADDTAYLCKLNCQLWQLSALKGGGAGFFFALLTD